MPHACCAQPPAVSLLGSHRYGSRKWMTKLEAATTMEAHLPRAQPSTYAEGLQSEQHPCSTWQPDITPAQDLAAAGQGGQLTC